jgi:hypothetical protein
MASRCTIGVRFDLERGRTGVASSLANQNVSARDYSIIVPGCGSGGFWYRVDHSYWPAYWPDRSSYHIALIGNVLYAVPRVILLGGFAPAIALFFSAIQGRFPDVDAVFARSVRRPDRKFPHGRAARNRAQCCQPYGIGPITILCFGLAYDSFKSAEATMADLI